METGKDAIHEVGEGGGDIAETKRDLVEFKELAAAGMEGRFLLVPLLDRDLPVSLLRPRVENQRAPCRASRRSSMRGMGCASFIVAALSCLKSTQNCRLPSFFLTMTTGEAQGLLEGRMTPFVNICWPGPFLLAEQRGFDGDTAGGGVVLWSRWRVAEAGCSRDNPRLGL